jgi:hypothetical protein
MRCVFAQPAIEPPTRFTSGKPQGKDTTQRRPFHAICSGCSTGDPETLDADKRKIHELVAEAVEECGYVTDLASGIHSRIAGNGSGRYVEWRFGKIVFDPNHNCLLRHPQGVRQPQLVHDVWIRPRQTVGSTLVGYVNEDESSPPDRGQYVRQNRIFDSRLFHTLAIGRYLVSLGERCEAPRLRLRTA